MPVLKSFIDPTSEDLLYLLDGLGIEIGVDLGRLLAASRFICDRLARTKGTKDKC